MKQMRLVMIGGLVGLTLALDTTWADLLPSSFTYVLESRSAAASTNKCGYTNETNCCSPVLHYYRQLETWHTIGFSRFGNLDCSFSGWAGNYADHRIWRKNPANYCEETNLLCEGSFTYDVPFNGFISEHANGIMDSNCSWTITVSNEYWAITNYGASLTSDVSSAHYFWEDADRDVPWWPNETTSTSYPSCAESITTSV